MELMDRCGRVEVCVFFFFSSRRRHTRLVSDWSSDVCSSDLSEKVEDRARVQIEYTDEDPMIREKFEFELSRNGLQSVRSEERRVGKECRSRGAPCNEKAKQRIEIL